MRRYSAVIVVVVVAASGLSATLARQSSSSEPVIKVDLVYGGPGTGPSSNFSPQGMQVPLADLSADVVLPVGATRPAKRGVMKIGPSQASWLSFVVAAAQPGASDLTRLLVDHNRNNRFDDDGAMASVMASQNEKTKDWWTSFNAIEVNVPYGNGVTEKVMTNFWLVRPDGAGVPEIARFSRRSWRTGKTTINGVPALVAAMDADNNFVFDHNDYWSVLESSAPKAETAVLTLTEARKANRFMFVPKDGKDLVLEFRSFSPDGRSVSFAVVDRPMTKVADRAPDDMIRDERPRARAEAKFTWLHDYNAALAKAKASNKKLFIDYETTWCGPCKTMDEWIWTDAEVASTLNAGFIGVKLDGDIEKALTKQHRVSGYPTMIILDAKGNEITRAVGYQSSKSMLVMLRK